MKIKTNAYSVITRWHRRERPYEFGGPRIYGANKYAFTFVSLLLFISEMRKIQMLKPLPHLNKNDFGIFRRKKKNTSNTKAQASFSREV